MIQAVLFDLDGTLLNTLGDIADSMNEALTEHGFEPHPEQDYTRFVGNGLRRLAQRAIPENGRDAQTVDTIARRFRQVYARRYTMRSRPYSGIESMLKTLEHHGFQTAVNSNKPQDMCEHCLEALLPGHRFARVVGHRDGRPLKPDPEGALEIASDLGISPTEMVYVGDSGVDMETACRASMHGLGVLWGFRSAEELLASGAQALIAKPSELLESIPRQPKAS